MNQIKFIIGNWKMNGLLADSAERVGQLVSAVKDIDSSAFKMVLCPPATLISKVGDMVGDSELELGGQDCHAEQSGAFTGNISAEMLKDIGAKYVILGHSERRQYHAETSEQVSQKALAAHSQGLVAVICIGEQGEDRDSGKANSVVAEQLAKSIPEGSSSTNTIIAYEPVWAIGTGKTASDADIKDMHEFIRSELSGKIEGADKTAILYGGSVKPDNANAILHITNVDGVLVGGASLKADDFIGIAKAS